MTTPRTNTGPSASYKVSTKEDTDGMTLGQEEQASVKKLTRANAAGKTQKELEKEWKQSVMQRLRDHNKADEIKYLDDNNWLGDQKDAAGNLLDPSGDGQALDGNDAFGNLWQNGTPQFQAGWKAAHNGAAPNSDQVYQNYTWGTSAHNPGEHLAGVMAGSKKKGEKSLMHDPAMQPITSVQRKQSDGTKKSANPVDDNYAVGARAGDLVKVTYPNGDVHYMPTDDTNSNASFYNSAKQSDLGEVSTHALYGYPAGTQFTVQSVGSLSNPTGGDHLTNDEWDEIGSNNYRNDDGTIPNTHDQLDAARAKAKKTAPQKASDASGGGGPKLLVGYPTVMHGADARNIGYADAASVHAAGGSMAEGSKTAFVGPEAFPISRVGDATTDDKVAVTGAGDFLVG